MKNHFLYLAVLATMISQSCQHDEVTDLDEQLTTLLKQRSETGDINFFVLPQSSDFSEIPQDANSALNTYKVELGKMLFHETAIGTANKNDGTQGTYSCASCHHIKAGFQAGTFQGVGEGGNGFGSRGEGRMFTDVKDIDVQPIRSPSAMNGAFQPLMLWNGQFGGTSGNIGTESQWTVGTPKETNKLGYEGLETQAIAGLEVHRMNVQKLVYDFPEYQQMFDKAFPEIESSERVSREHAGLAIAAYERTLLSNQAPFQKYLKGNKFALGEDEKRGAMLFFGKANCVSCHTGPALNKMEFYSLGMKDLFECKEHTLKTYASNIENLGRGGFTGKTSDNYKFKVPQIYNLKDSPFFGHGATFRSIKDIIRYKNLAVAQKNNFDNSLLDPQFKPLGLTESEMDDITTFIEFSLYDPNLIRYLPDELPSGQCFPNNDAQSRIDLHCN